MESFLEFKRIIQKSQMNYTSPWYARKVTRKLSPFITWVLVKTPATANQVTLFQFFVGLAGLYLLAHKSTFMALSGALLLHIAYVFDCVDGEVARYKKSQSINGMFLDFINHHAVIPFIYSCLAFHYYFLTESTVYFTLGLIILICRINPISRARFSTINYLIEKRNSPTYDIRNYQKGDEIKSPTRKPKSKAGIIELVNEIRKMVWKCFEYPNDLIVILALLIVELAIKNSILAWYFLILFCVYSAANFILSLYVHLTHNVVTKHFYNYAEAFSEINNKAK